jgi:glycosyltransferase involved in cell wall biosynthesis
MNELMNNDARPLVSISTMSKNLEGIIADGFKSWLAQKATFKFEIVLSDDFSTDNTVAVVKKIQQEHPDKIKILTDDKPLGLGKNWLKCMKACSGKYIAFCDGDDLWTDPLKLQKQIDYMEAHPDCNLICSDYDYLSETGEFIVSEWKKDWYGKKFNMLENLKDSIATTLTTVIRKSALDPFLNSVTLDNHPFIWDIVLWTYTLQNGYGYFYPEKMALRRVQASGIYTTKSILGRAKYDFGSIQSMKLLIKDKEVQDYLNQSLYALNLAVAKENFKLGNKSEGRSHLMKSAFTWNGFQTIQHNLKYIYWLIRSFAFRLS